MPRPGSISRAWTLALALASSTSAWQQPPPGRRRRGALSLAAKAPSRPAIRADERALYEEAQEALAPWEPPAAGLLPSLVVFDLDNTLWTPELYTLKRLDGYPDASGDGPQAYKDVRLFDAAAEALEQLASDPVFKDVAVAVASRTNKGPWAQKLLKAFQVGEGTLDDLVAHKEIYVGEKTAHFLALRDKSGVEFERMLFFDDSKVGRYGNCEKVAELGVMAAHCPDGLTTSVWRNALSEFAASAAAADGTTGRVVDVPPDEELLAPLVDGRVVNYNVDKRYGFIRLDTRRGSGSDVFFHRSAVKRNSGTGKIPVGRGSPVQVRVGRIDNKVACTEVRPVPEVPGDPRAGDEAVVLPCFSMGMPFAALVAHGYKTIETRNWPMLENFAGKRIALHVGQRWFADADEHRRIMAEEGLSEAEMDRLTTLPAGFKKGHVVAVVELGETVRVQDEESRAVQAIEVGAVATAADMGSYLTEITRATFLKPPGLGVTHGNPGVWETTIPRESIPEDVFGCGSDGLYECAIPAAPQAPQFFRPEDLLADDEDEIPEDGDVEDEEGHGEEVPVPVAAEAGTTTGDL